MLSIEDKREQKNNSADRIIELRPIDGKKSMAVTGLIDSRLFTGENKLHALMDAHGLWSLKYDSGGLPEPLRQRFTGFGKLYNFAKDYFYRRNIEIKEVVNA